MLLRGFAVQGRSSLSVRHAILFDVRQYQQSREVPRNQMIRCELVPKRLPLLFKPVQDIAFAGQICSEHLHRGKYFRYISVGLRILRWKCLECHEEHARLSLMMMSLFVLAETKISPTLYTPRPLPTIRGCSEGLALMIRKSRMVLAAVEKIYKRAGKKKSEATPDKRNIRRRRTRTHFDNRTHTHVHTSTYKCVHTHTHAGSYTNDHPRTRTYPRKHATHTREQTYTSGHT